MRAKERGFSLIEVTVTIVIVSVLVIIAYTMIEETLRTTMFNESQNDLMLMSQRSVNTMQTEILQAALLFEENALGTSYRAALRIPAPFTQWNDTLLPVVDSGLTLAPDTSTRNTGNSLFIVRQLPPIAVTHDHDNAPGTPDVEFLADRYRFEYFFLCPTTTRSFGRSGQTLDLVHSRSGEYADYFQLRAMGGETAELATKLIARGLTHAWDRGQPLNAAFFTLAGATDGAFDAALGSPTITMTRNVSLFPELRGGRATGRIDYSVAFEPANRPAFPLRFPIRSYSLADNTRPGFPSGFEVKVVGPTGNRKVMTRVMLMSNYAASKYGTQQGFVTTAGRF
jgi:prepilin-type N-terminal cleavage/methylation domain-containing protein